MSQHTYTEEQLIFLALIYANNQLTEEDVDNIYQQEFRQAA